METGNISGNPPVGMPDDVRPIRTKHQQGNARIGLKCINNRFEDDPQSLIRVF